MLRIHFTADDLARTCVAAAPQVGVELSCALWRFVIRQDPPVLGRWQQGLRGQLNRRTAVLFDLATSDYVADFVGPIVPGLEPADTFEAIRSIGRGELRAGLAELARYRVLSPAVRQLAHGGSEAVRALGDAADDFYQAGISPYWTDVRRSAEADRARRGRVILDGGVERLLTTLHPNLRWRPPFLEAPLCTTYDKDMHLNGRGVLLVPSVFAGSRPVLMPSRPGPLVIAYPVMGAETTTAPQPLAALLGRTRAAVLTLVAAADTCTTGEIARRLQISPASASTHATVLREAGLIATGRHGPAVIHTVTARGIDLLDR